MVKRDRNIFGISSQVNDLQGEDEENQMHDILFKKKSNIQACKTTDLKSMKLKTGKY